MNNYAATAAGGASSMRNMNASNSMREMTGSMRDMNMGGGDSYAMRGGQRKR